MKMNGRGTGVISGWAKQWLVRHEQIFMAVMALRRCPHLPAMVLAWRRYRSIVRQVRGFSRDPPTRTAIVLHLYHDDLWGRFLGALEGLGRSVNFDLFVTLADANGKFADVVHESFPRAVALPVPNLGRDVLPFMQIAPALMADGYEYVLKLHSKKSPHHPDADNWFEAMIGYLVPSDPEIVEDLLRILGDAGTGLVGPQGQYLSLKVWLGNNVPYLRSALRRLGFQAKATEVLDQMNYGFLAGTMFWARLDSFGSIFRRNFSLLNYDAEAGRTNSTFPHALERLFSIVPALEGRALYEIGPAELHPIDLTSGAVPWWSDAGTAERAESGAGTSSSRPAG